MNKVVLSLIIATLVLVTVGICVFRPKMHNTVMIYPSNYVVVEPAPKQEPVKPLPAQVNQVTQVKTVKIEEPQKQKTQTLQKQVQTTKSSVKNATSQPVVKQEVKQVLAPKVEQKVEVIAPPKKETVVETQKEQQEMILWNIWRSNLQNQIMRDVKLPLIKEGTVFKFSFDVDKYGKISNVRTWSLDSAYTPYAIQYIAPVIHKYQGRSILDFPEGSNRVTTTVEGGWKISKTAKYSTPADFNDTEKVKR